MRALSAFAMFLLALLTGFLSICLINGWIVEFDPVRMGCFLIVPSVALVVAVAVIFYGMDRECR